MSIQSSTRRGSGAGQAIGAFLFDVDGVLTDTARLHTAAWRRLTDEEGLTLDEPTAHALRGLSREASLRRILGNRTPPPEQFEAMLDRKNRYYVESLRSLSPADVLPGVSRLLDQLRRRRVRLAAVSVSRNAQSVIRAVGLDGAFDAIIDGNAPRSPGGLNRFQIAAASLRTEPGRCVVVEDSTEGVALARRAGMKTIGIGDASRLCAATLVFESLRGVEARLLLKWLSGDGPFVAAHEASQFNGRA